MCEIYMGNSATLVEPLSAEQIEAMPLYEWDIAMVGDGNSRHLEFHGLLNKRFVTTGTVKKTEAGVEMEMDEVRHDT